MLSDMENQTLPKKMGFTHDNKNNITADWWTPKNIFDDLGIVFDLDQCSPENGVPWLPANKIYTKDDDGLAQQWHGNVWVNPPYGSETGKWMERLYQHGNGIALVFSRTDCKWFHDYVSKADAILFLKGRVKFVDGYGATKSSGAGSGSLLAAFGANNVKALENMKDKGYLVYPSGIGELIQ